MYKTFGHSGLPISILKDGKIGQDIESSCTKTKLLKETLREDSLTAALKETEFECQGKNDQISTFG